MTSYKVIQVLARTAGGDFVYGECTNFEAPSDGAAFAFAWLRRGSCVLFRGDTWLASFSVARDGQPR